MQLRDKVASLLALTSVEWTCTWTVGGVRPTVTSLMSVLSPVAVVVGAPRRQRLRPRWSVARRLFGLPDAKAVVTVVPPA
jgi:hypothetical protein